MKQLWSASLFGAVAEIKHLTVTFTDLRCGYSTKKEIEKKHFPKGYIACYYLLVVKIVIEKQSEMMMIIIKMQLQRRISEVETTDVWCINNAESCGANNIFYDFI